MIDLSLRQAQALAVVAQELHKREAPPAAGMRILASLGCIQLDTINAVRRSHELVLLSRGTDDREAAGFLDPPAPVAFEYWAHAASLIPVDMWPLLAFRRRQLRAYGWRGPEVDPAACRYVRDAVADLGEATITELGGAGGSGWDRAAPAKWAAEWLLAIGEFACVKRRGFSRVYQMSAAVVPAHLLDAEPGDDECIAELAEIAVAALGVATADDIADYFRLPAPAVASYLRDQEKFEPATVEGWPEPAWISPAAVNEPSLNLSACTPLSPFDSLVWHRPRVRRLFGVSYVLEAYKPAKSRECGYFGMPVLAGTEIAGRVAVRCSRGVTRLEGWQLALGHDPRQLHQAVHFAAAWSGSPTIEANELCPPACQLVDRRG